MRRILAALAACLVLLSATAIPAKAQTLPEPTPETEKARRGDTLERTPPIDEQLHELRHAAARLPIAVALACILALRPRRRGTPPRQAPVIQTQIILAVVGAVVMLVVGSSLARAFGIVGAAGLVRYRAKIEDPKDAGVMLSTLAVGLASGVGLWMLATFATMFIVAVLWVVESFEPRARQPFMLKVKAKDPAKLKPELEKAFQRNRVKSELRGESKEELIYELRIPLDRKPDRLPDIILAIDPDNVSAAELEEKKEKK
jgi:uncharacterized membrane protein YhiD involved in acid resistance